MVWWLAFIGEGGTAPRFEARGKPCSSVRRPDSRRGENLARPYERTMVLENNWARRPGLLDWEETAGVVLLTPIKTILVPCHRTHPVNPSRHTLVVGFVLPRCRKRSAGAILAII